MLKWYNIFAIVFGFFIAIMVFVWIFRFNNVAIAQDLLPENLEINAKHTAFMPFSAFIKYFESVDLWKPFREFMTNISDLGMSFSRSILDYSASNFGEWLASIGNILINLFKLMVYPVSIIYYIFYFIGLFFYEVFRFFGFVIGYEGVPLVLE